MRATCLYISKAQKDYPVFRMVFFHDDERLLIRADKKSLENKIEICFFLIKNKYQQKRR